MAPWHAEALLTRRLLSRRDFVVATATATTVAATRRSASAQRPLTAGDVAERFRAGIGLPWRDKTTDGIKAGDLSTVVTGIAVAVTPTMDVLRRAAADGHNMFVVEEPTFYAPNEAPGSRANDPVYLAKRALVDDRKLVIFRLSEHWHARRPNPAAAGLAATLGWSKAGIDGSEYLYAIPHTTVAALTAHVRDALGARALRVVGRQDMPVRTVFVSPGTTAMPAVLTHLPRADVVISGEPREWEAVPYVLDTWSANLGKGMIAVGRVASLSPGARLAAVWVRSMVSEVPVTFIDTPDPYWSPAAT
jgi:putative NIF3 family GTP cyclohydrolase 1 type 2